MPTAVIVGTQWGDEGKGKIVDLYAHHADAVVRYGGGANAGHTLVVNGQRLVFHLMPSGALHSHVHSVLGHGMVIDPAGLLEEIATLRDQGCFDPTHLHIAERAHIVLPYHKVVDRCRDQADDAIGTTQRGIGPAYEDKVGRRGIRMVDLLDAAQLGDKIRRNLSYWSRMTEGDEFSDIDPDALTKSYADYGNQLRAFMKDSSRFIDAAAQQGQRVLFEGAQGSLLDIDYGTYPYVTSSNVITSGASTGASGGCYRQLHAIGIAKAYTTRVGSGPFPTEQEGAVGETLRNEGHEYGATTGRPRRCGWLDTAALRMAVRTNGLQALALTKLDVLSHFESIGIGIGYQHGDQSWDEPPSTGWENLEASYEYHDGWQCPIDHCRSFDDLPTQARRFIDRIEHLVGCPITTISVGPDRKQTLGALNPFKRPQQR